MGARRRTRAPRQLHTPGFGGAEIPDVDLGEGRHCHPRTYGYVAADEGAVMRRRSLVTSLALVAALVVACAEDRSDEDRSAGDPRPNIVVIMTDDQTLASMSVLTKTEG